MPLRSSKLSNRLRFIFFGGVLCTTNLICLKRFIFLLPRFGELFQVFGWFASSLNLYYLSLLFYAVVYTYFCAKAFFLFKHEGWPIVLAEAVWCLPANRLIKLPVNVPWRRYHFYDNRGVSLHVFSIF